MMLFLITVVFLILKKGLITIGVSMEYIKVVVKQAKEEYLIGECNGIGYKIFITNYRYFKKNDEVLIYIYEDIKETSHQYYGFKDKEERNLFLSLIKVRGVGVKLSQKMLMKFGYSDLTKILLLKDQASLRQVKGVSAKLAREIVETIKLIDSRLENIYQVLLSLKIDKHIIDGYISEINYEQYSDEEIINQVLKKARKY